ncbi:MAG: hypothetical protein AAGF20_04405 [Pseudomonadota bacterium]
MSTAAAYGTFPGVCLGMAVRFAGYPRVCSCPQAAGLEAIKKPAQVEDVAFNTMGCLFWGPGVRRTVLSKWKEM